MTFLKLALFVCAIVNGATSVAANNGNTVDCSIDNGGCAQACGVATHGGCSCFDGFSELNNGANQLSCVKDTSVLGVNMTDGYANAGGSIWHYVEGGDKHLPAAVFLHGAGGSWYLWSYQYPDFVSSGLYRVSPST